MSCYNSDMSNKDVFTYSNFRFPNAAENIVNFSIKAKGETVIASFCRPCPLLAVCFGEKGEKTGIARINLDKPIVQNLTTEEADVVPCGVCVEIMSRRTSVKGLSLPVESRV